jgi:ribosomal RNA-processing protein 36
MSGLSSLPLGALRKAQQALTRAKVFHDSDSEDDTDDRGSLDDNSESEPEEQISPVNLKGKQKAQEKEKKEIAKRKNKHA